MARIFSVLALFAIVLLLANFFVGLWIGDFNAAAREKRAAGEQIDQLQRQLRVRRERTSSELEQAKQEYLAADQQFQSPRGRMTVHMLLGQARRCSRSSSTASPITYFIGTSRWCKEVCETYRLPADLAERGTRLKRGTFPWALAGIVTLILLVGLGAAADPSGANWNGPIRTC